MAISPTELGTETDCAGKRHQKLTRLTDWVETVTRVPESWDCVDMSPEGLGTKNDCLQGPPAVYSTRLDAQLTTCFCWFLAWPVLRSWRWRQYVTLPLNYTAVQPRTPDSSYCRSSMSHVLAEWNTSHSFKCGFKHLGKSACKCWLKFRHVKA
jgi:hypothetical protein